MAIFGKIRLGVKVPKLWQIFGKIRLGVKVPKLWQIFEKIGLGVKVPKLWQIFEQLASGNSARARQIQKTHVQTQLKDLPSDSGPGGNRTPPDPDGPYCICLVRH